MHYAVYEPRQNVIRNYSNPPISERISENRFDAFERLPSNMQLEILSQTNLSELKKLCTFNKTIRRLCSDDQLWQLRVKNEFPNRPKSDSTGYEDYIKAYRSEKLRPYIKAHNSLSQFISDELSSLVLQSPNYNFETLYKKPPSGLDYTISEYNTLIKYRKLMMDPVFFNQVINTPIPDLHYLSIVVYGGDRVLYSEKINQYDITIRDLNGLIQRIRGTGIASTPTSYRFSVLGPHVRVFAS